MNLEDFEKYEEIRSIVNKEWLKPSMVSLTRLDQVKAKVYNLTPSDPHQLRAKDARCEVVFEPEFGLPQPPLSNINLQANAWGSNTSIPELIKQQSERQKFRQTVKGRPGSAKVSRQTRPPSGRKARPHSAKNTSSPSSPATAGKPALQLLQGAQCDLTQRPPEGVRYSGSVGFIAPPGSMMEDISSDTDDILDRVARGQTHCQKDPSASCASPNTAMMETQINNSEGDLEPGSPRLGRPPLQLLRRPTPEAIKLSLPQAMLEADDVEEEIILQDISSHTVQTNSSVEYEDTLDNPEGPAGTKESTSALSQCDSFNRSFEDKDPSDTNSWAYSTGPKSIRVKSAKKNARVKFSDTTETKDITPRERVNSASNHKRELKYKSKPGEPPDNVMSKNKARVSLVAVAYPDEDNDAPANEASHDKTHHHNTKAYKKRKAFAHKHEIESQMSRLSLSDEENASDSTLLETKYTSQNTDRNYYEMCKQGAEKSRNKTIKTLEFGDSGVEENKTIERIDTQMPQARTNYQAPPPSSGRPGSAVKPSRPSSAKKEAQDKGHHLHLGKSEDSSHARLSKPHSAYRSLDENSRSTTDTQPRGTPTIHIDTTSESDLLHEAPLFVKSRTPNQNAMKHMGGSTKEVDKMVSEAAEKTDEMKSKLLRVASAPPMQRKRSIDLGKPRPKSAAIPTTECSHEISIDNLQRPSNHSNTSSRTQSASSVKRKPVSAKKEEPKKKVIEIWTRREDTEIETEGISYCKGIQEKMIANGIPISLATLKRALLPPTEYATKPGYSNSKDISRPSLPAYNSGLLSRPSTWLPTEYKRLLKAKRLVREAKEALFAQRQEEERKQQIMYLDPVESSIISADPDPVPQDVSLKKKKRKKRSGSAGSQRSRPTSAKNSK